MKTAFAASVAGLVALLGVDAAHACEPILDLLLFSSDIPGGCPVPTSTPSKSSKLCFGAKCRSFGGTDKGEFGQFKKDQPGHVQATILEVTNTVTGDTVTVVNARTDPSCANLIPDATPGVSCTALFKIKGIRPIGAGLSGPLCTFDDIDQVDKLTTTPEGQHVVLIDANGQPCLARVKSQYWVFYKICCEPGSAFGAGGQEVDIKASLVIDNGGQCSVDPIREDPSPEVIPLSDSPPCL